MNIEISSRMARIYAGFIAFLFFIAFYFFLTEGILEITHWNPFLTWLCFIFGIIFVVITIR